MVSAFECNKAETTAKLPVIEAFVAARRLPDVTIVADARHGLRGDQKDIEAAGLSFVLGMKISQSLTRSRRGGVIPRQEIPNGQVFTQPWPAGTAAKWRDQVIYSSSATTAPEEPCAGSMAKSPRPSGPSWARS